MIFPIDPWDCTKVEPAPKAKGKAKAKAKAKAAAKVQTREDDKENTTG